MTNISKSSLVALVFIQAIHPFPVHSLDILGGLKKEVFDFVLHDGSHDAATVKKDIQNILPRMMRNGIILVHDTEHPTKDYGLPKAVKVALRFRKHSRVTLPYGYGLTIIRVEEDFGNGAVQIRWKKQS